MKKIIMTCEEMEKDLKFLINLMYMDKPMGMTDQEMHTESYKHIYRIAKKLKWKKCEQKPNVVGL